MDLKTKKLANELRARWKTPEGQKQAHQILRALQTNQDLGRLDFLERHQDRWDLRGLPLPDVKVKGAFPFKSYQVEQIGGITKFKNVRLLDTDLSHADLDESLWHSSLLRNVELDSASLRHSGFWACEFQNVTCRHTDLRDTALGGNIGERVSAYRRVDFSYADLSKTAHGFALYEDCDFSYANLKDINFDGARFRRCKFAGLVSGAMFHGHAKFPSMPVYPWEKVDVCKFTNPMEQIDFTEADLRGVKFEDVDISTCLFPSNNDLLVIHNQSCVFSKAREIVEREWEGEDRRIALSLIDTLHLTDKTRHQPMQVMNKQDDIEFIGREFGERFFCLIQNLSSSLG